MIRADMISTVGRAYLTSNITSILHCLFEPCFVKKKTLLVWAKIGT